MRAPSSLPPLLLDSVSSCFTLLLLIPRAAASHPLLAPGRRARGHAFLLSGREGVRLDPEHVTHWRAQEATCARALLVLSHRGALEMPGGRREAGEALAAAAQRELEEKTGVRLLQPLSEADAALTAVERATGRPRWQLYLRVLRSSEEFHSGSYGSQPMEAWGLAGVPLGVEDLHRGGRVGGFPRALAAMPPWQAELLLPLLVQGGVLSEAEALVCARAADAFLAAGGARSAPAAARLEAALAASLADLRGAGELRGAALDLGAPE